MALVTQTRWLLDKQLLPDVVFRGIVRYMLGCFLRQWYRLTSEEQIMHQMQLVTELKKMPIVNNTDELRDMYQVPADFFKSYLSKRLKLSCLYFPKDSYTVDEAEDAILDLYCKRAKVMDGQSILDIGGGFGSLALYIAERFPSCKITTLSYSKVHKDYIDSKCSEGGFTSITVLDADLSNFESEEKFDCIFAIQVLEHLKNLQALFKKISTWLNPDGRFFVELCCHKSFAYKPAENPTSSLTFDTGDIVPSDNLLLYFQEDLFISQHWRLNGMHHAKTCDAWLKRMDASTPALTALLGEETARRMVKDSRVYFMIWGEMFKYRNGEEWMVSHYLFKKK